MIAAAVMVFSTITASGSIQDNGAFVSDRAKSLPDQLNGYQRAF